MVSKVASAAGASNATKPTFSSSASDKPTER